MKIMPVSSDHFTDFKVLVNRASNNEESAFREIYDSTCGKMYSLCLRYTSNKEDANDALQEGYLKIFRNLNQYKVEGSFEGWARRIFVTTCLDFLKKKRLVFSEVKEDSYLEASDITGLDKLNLDELMKIIQQLPNGYRTVFNLYLIEGYNHNEISEMLGITVSSSKSQLAKAKEKLKELVTNAA